MALLDWLLDSQPALERSARPASATTIEPSIPTVYPWQERARRASDNLRRLHREQPL